MKISDLYETPQIIPGLTDEENLDSFSVNKSKYSELAKLHNKKEISRLSDDVIIYQSGRMNFCLDTSRKEVTYYMQYEVSTNKVFGSFLWQSLVWRSKKVQYNKAMPHKIFFNTLLPKFKVIVTDGMQTVEGKRFWEFQIAFAIENDINVYFFDDKSKELIKVNTLIEFDKVSRDHDVWGETPIHKSKLMVITTKELIN